MNAYPLTVNFDKALGPVKPMHGVGQPPFTTMNEECFHYLTEAHIPFSRLHDVGGAYGGGIYVDIPNIFRRFDADENDPASYDFAFTDWLLSALDRAKCEPIYRLGVTIENFYNIRSYRIHPPKDYDKWARICEHIISHYIDGWADGFHFKITRWEIWNEPDNTLPNFGNQMWTGTAEDYYRLYAVTAKHLKGVFGDRIMVGGFASCGFYALFDEMRSPDNEVYIDYFVNFLKYIREENAPLDFFSWHSYADTEHTRGMARYAVKTLEEYGYGGIETQLNEWNNAPRRQYRGTSYAAAQAAAMMMAQQREGTSMLCYYDARVGASTYGGLFNPITFTPFCAYYAFYAFGQLYAMGTEAECECAAPGVYAMAARGQGRKGVMIANAGGESVCLDTGLYGMSLYIIDSEHMFEKMPWDGGKVTLEAYQTALILDGEPL